MKVLVISECRDKKCRVECGSDSAILRYGEPVFVPEPTEDWHSSIVPAVRISRLGMSIPENKARGYYSEITAFHLLVPASESVVEGISPYVLDRAFSPGEWINIDSLGNTARLNACVGAIGNSNDDVTRYSHSFAIADLRIDHTISYLSRYITFKTGDILIYTQQKLDFGTPQLNTSIRVTLNSEEILSIRIK